MIVAKIGRKKMKSHGYTHLLEPSYIGSVKTRNRLIKSAAGTWYWSKGDNPVSEKARCVYESFAAGGVGLIVVESPSIEEGGKSYRLDNEHHRKSIAGLTKSIHKYGCPVFVQIADMANWNIAKLAGADTRGASPVSVLSEMDNHDSMPRELTIPEIEEVVEKFARNALWAREAGFDGVEINSSCSHLLHTFLSPFWNKRNDAYGWHNLEDRTRLLVSIIKEIKKRAGHDFPVMCLLNGLETGKLIDVDDYECMSLEDCLKVAPIIQAAGADAVQIRSQWIGRHDASFLTDHMCYPEPPVPLMNFPKELDMSRHGAGANVPLATAVKKVVTIPVITVGRLDPEMGESIIREGRADFIAMTRRLVADPELPNKLATGRFHEIAPCTSCTQCKDEEAPRRCRINAALGTESMYTIEPAQDRKKVVIVGGGPGGMEAARVAAVRGHEVTLFEKSSRLGGLLPLAAMVKGIEVEDLPAITRYFEDQLSKRGVTVFLNTEATPETVSGLKPDIVILAGGGIAVLPDIPGIHGSNVVSNMKLHRMLKFFLRFMDPATLNTLTKFWMPLGKKVVIIGGGIQGCELAEFLVKRGRNVTIVESDDGLGKGMISHLRAQLFWWFRKKGVVMMPGVQSVEVTQAGLTVMTKHNYKKTIEADSVVTALPLQPDHELLRRYEGTAPEIIAIGDCAAPGLIVDAIGDGWRVSRQI
jgi:2,4-dienoyl-CoA reductase (NADPH2)